LQEHGIEVVVDVRRYPSSRKFPQYNQRALAEALRKNGIEYVWMEELGGRRHGRTSSESLNRGLRSPGFRNYADHMLTPGFRSALERLVAVAARKRVAVMCAEKLYFRCHRMLLSDSLVAMGVSVIHIIEPGRVRPHELTPSARVVDGERVIYPGNGGLFPQEGGG